MTALDTIPPPTNPSAASSTPERAPLPLPEAILDAMPQLVFIKDEDGQFVFVNQALAGIFGSGKQNILGKRDGDFISDKEQVRKFRNDDLTVQLTKKRLKVSEEYLRDSVGINHRLATIKTPLPTADGRLLVLGVATDISEMPHNTSDVDQLRLSIIGDLVHAVKSPIAAISMNVSNLERELQDHDDKPKLVAWWARYVPWLLARSTRRRRRTYAREYVRHIKDALGQMAITDRTLLAIAQMSAPATEDAPKTTLNLAKLVRDSVDEVRKLLALTGDVFAVRVAGNAMDAKTSVNMFMEPLIKTSLFNILHNAVKFSRNENPEVRVALLVSGSTAQLVVQDFGIGIAPDDLSRIFEPGFTRRAPAQPQGSGMGLTTAKAAFTRLQWTMDVVSKQGEGTSVAINIPILN